MPPKVLNLCTTTEVDYDQAQYVLTTGSVIGNIGTGRLGEIGYMPADRPTFDDAVSGPDAKGWIASMGEETNSLIDHDVFDWVYSTELVKHHQADRPSRTRHDRLVTFPLPSCLQSNP